jgi:predicted nucleic acid-binding protein
VRFWDSSAIVPIVFDEPSSPTMRAIADDGTGMQVWWATPVECLSALGRRERAGDIDRAGFDEALTFLDRLGDGWGEIPPSDAIREIARRIVLVHELRAGDAFQLAAARAASDDRPASLPFVTLDDRLALAARREGFPILP